MRSTAVCARYVVSRDDCRLAAFAAEHADHVASWVRDAHELYQLAPRTAWPLTGLKLLAWLREGRYPRLLYLRGQRSPVGYGEVNLLAAERGEWWLGHLVVDPACRGRGLGTALAALLLQVAFEEHDAQVVSLVVFPANEAAIRCYRSAGLIEAGYETHDFPAVGRRERLLRMSLSRPRFLERRGRPDPV